MAAGNGRLRGISPAATPEETAAIVAAIERFMRATAPAPAQGSRGVDGWRRAAVLEGVERETLPDQPNPWINT